ncbi:hypothetical protein HN51_031534 [Arachis hypogaea]
MAKSSLAEKRIRELLGPEMGQMSLEFKKGWGPICMYFASRDFKAFGDFSQEQIRSMAQQTRSHRRILSESPIYHGRAPNWRSHHKTHGRPTPRQFHPEIDAMLTPWFRRIFGIMHEIVDWVVSGEEGAPIPEERMKEILSKRFVSEKRNIRDHKCRLLTTKYELRRKLYKAFCKDSDLPSDMWDKLRYKLSKLPRNSSFARVRNRCISTGCPRSVYEFFRISRIVFRGLASRGVVPYPYLPDEVIGGDCVGSIQHRLLDHNTTPSAPEIELARYQAEDLLRSRKVDIIRQMAGLDPTGDWMGKGARALDNPRTAPFLVKGAAPRKALCPTGGAAATRVVFGYLFRIKREGAPMDYSG